MRPLFTCLLSIIVFFVQAQQPKIENNQLILDKQVTFKTGSNELTEEGKAALQQVKDFLVAKDYITLLRVEGHSDNTGNADTLQKNTQQKALAVCRWLIDNGIDCKRVMPVGFGSTKPVESNDRPQGKASNRRIVFALASLRGRLIGGTPADGGGVVAGEVCR